MADPSEEWRRVCTELLGTFVLVFVAAGAPAVGARFPGSISTDAAVVAPALAVIGLVYAFGDVSGMHINPAVTIGFALRGAFPWHRVPAYVVAQLAGGVAAAALIRSLVGVVGHLGATTPGGGDWRALVTEITLTGMLVVVILGTSYGAKIVGHNGALAVGGWIAAAGLVGSPLSGASMNPARSIGPDLIRGDMVNTWIYVVGPILGAVVAAGIATILHGRPSDAERRAAEGAPFTLRRIATPGDGGETSAAADDVTPPPAR
ncbi:MAG: MIP/aquaporin family protein [Dehalococcoidia bacterium]